MTSSPSDTPRWPEKPADESYVVWICPRCRHQSHWEDGRAYHPCDCLADEAHGWRVTPRVPLAVIPRSEDR